MNRWLSLLTHDLNLLFDHLFSYVMDHWSNDESSSGIHPKSSYKETLRGRKTLFKTTTGDSVSLTSCSVSGGGSEMWASGPDRRGRPAAECDWSGPTTETRADEPEESPPHTWRQHDTEEWRWETEGKEPAERRRRTAFGLKGSEASSVAQVTTSHDLTFIQRVTQSVLFDLGLLRHSPEEPELCGVKQ